MDRFANVQMRGDGSGFGIIVHQTNAKSHWEYLEQDGPVYPEWKLTHWRPIPAAPCVSDGDAKREDAQRLSPEGMPARPSDSEGRP